MWEMSIFGINIPHIYGFQWFQSYLASINIEPMTFRSFIGSIHRSLTTLLLILVGLHVFVIIFNRIFRKTGELKRMM